MTWLVLLAALWEPRLVWRGAEVNLVGQPSRDGQWVSFVSEGNLALRHAADGRVVRLTQRPAGSKEFAYFSTVSPDGGAVAFAWKNGEGYYDLRLVNVSTREVKILFQNEEAGFVQPCAWMPDGRSILTLFFRKDNTSQIALVPAAGGLPRTLKSLNWVYPKKMDISPDGAWIAYDTLIDGSQDRALYLLRTDGSGERRLLAREAGSHLFPVFTPDGKSIAFVSEWNGKTRLATADLATERTRVLVADAGRALILGMTAAGELYWGVRQGTQDVYVEGKPIATKYPGRNMAPAWSPDGKTLAYLSRRGTENFGRASRALVLWSADGEREVETRLANLERTGWSASGKLLVEGSDGLGRSGVFEVDAKTGAVRLTEEPMVKASRTASVAEREESEIWSMKVTP